MIYSSYMKTVLFYFKAIYYWFSPKIRRHVMPEWEFKARQTLESPPKSRVYYTYPNHRNAATSRWIIAKYLARNPHTV